MPRRATGELRPTALGWEARVTLQGKERIGLPLKAFAPADEAGARARCEALAELAARLRSAGRLDVLRPFLKRAAAARSGRAWENVLETAEVLCAGRDTSAAQPITFAEFAKGWHEGELAARHPDHVAKKRSADRDEQLLRLYVNPRIGDIALADVTLEDAESVMASLPERLSPATRRHVAQVIRRVLTLAVYPGRKRAENPIPRGWLPRLRKTRAKGFLYPAEEKTLMGCIEVPLLRRLLYGFLCREGMRSDEAATLQWRHVDLDRGWVSLDENKTDDPRAWSLAPDVLRALKRWKELEPPTSESALVFSVRGVGVNVDHLAAKLRRDLKRAGVDRSLLFENTEARRRLVAHDLRATFVTVSLAAGKTERWVKDRTGHASEALNAYVRPARQWAEAELGFFAPLDEAIPELRTEADGAEPKAPAKAPLRRLGRLRRSRKYAWCTGRDLNPHALRRRNLNPERTAQCTRSIEKTSPDSDPSGGPMLPHGAIPGQSVGPSGASHDLSDPSRASVLRALYGLAATLASAGDTAGARIVNEAATTLLGATADAGGAAVVVDIDQARRGRT